jgi:hypothetical protein
MIGKEFFIKQVTSGEQLAYLLCNSYLSMDHDLESIRLQLACGFPSCGGSAPVLKSFIVRAARGAKKAGPFVGNQKQTNALGASNELAAGAF